MRSPRPMMRRGMGVTLVVAQALGVGACFTRDEPGGAQPIVATVDGAPITLAEFEAELKRLSLDGPDSLPSSTTEAVQKRALIDNLIEIRLLVQEAERHHVVVGMDEVDALYERTRHGWESENDDPGCEECMFEEALRVQGLTQGELKRELRHQLMIKKYFRDHVFSRVAVTDDEIDRHLATHPSLQVAPEQVRALQVLVKTAEQAEEVLRELRKGMAFEDAAMKYSLSPEARNGGDLGYFARGEMPTVFDETCFALKPGSISKVVPSQQGFHVFKLVDHRPAGDRPLSQVREEIEQALRRDKEQAAQAEKTSALKKAAEIQIHENVISLVQ